MKHVRPFLVLALLLIVLPIAAKPVKYKDWEKSPEYLYLATSAEKKEWKAVQTDEQAEKYIELFWARRCPDPAKAWDNPFRRTFEARVAKADELFRGQETQGIRSVVIGELRGALTYEGRFYILVGPPTRLGRRNGTQTQREEIGEDGKRRTVDPPPDDILGVAYYIFRYEPPDIPAWAGMKQFDIGVRERGFNTPFSNDLEKKAVAASLLHPDLKELPPQLPKPAGQPVATAAAPAGDGAGPALSAPVREILEKALAGEPAGPLSLMPMAYSDGATRLMAQLFVPASTVPSPDAAKLAILVRTKEGKDAVRLEEAAALKKVKTDFFVDRSLPVTAGEYDVAIAILDAAGAPLAIAKRSGTVPPLPTEFSTSPLFLAVQDIQVEGAKPDDPFVFSSWKFVGKGTGRSYEKSDGISYAFRIYNPGIDPATKKISLKRAIWVKPKKGMAMEVPLPPDEPVAAPELKDGKTIVVLDMAGNIVEANMGQYFAPGELELKVKVTDQVLGKSIEISAPFTLAGPAAPPPPPAKK